MKNMFKLLIFVALFATSVSGSAQDVVKGRVTDSETGKPLQDVEIRYVGSKHEVSTGEDGTFQIAKTGTTFTLLFNHPDYDQKRVNTRDHEGILEVDLVSNIRYNQYGQKVGRQLLTSESRGGFITWESEDKNYRVWMDNRIYLDGAHYFDNYDKDLTPDENQALGQLNVPGQALKLRRMRFALKALVGYNWYGEIDFDFAGNEVDIKDAYIRRFLGKKGEPWGHVRIGQFRMPMGMQQTTTSRYLKLIERASVYKFNPNRRLGIGYGSWNKNYMFSMGLFTEEVTNMLKAEYFKGFDDAYGNAWQGVEPMRGVSARAAWYPINEDRKLVSVSGGFVYNTPGYDEKARNRIKIDPKDETKVSEMEFLQLKVDGAETYLANNLEFATSNGPWRMTGEYYWTKINRQNMANINLGGWYLQSAWIITGESHPWNYREAEFTQVRANDRSRGAIEVVARYSYMNLNDFSADIRGGEKGQFTVGLNYYASRNVKFMLNYSYVDHDRYANGGGDFVDYIDDTLPVGKSGFDYGFLAWRCEIDF